MEEQEYQRGILIELRMIRRAVKGMLFIFAAYFVWLASHVIHPEIGDFVVFLAVVFIVIVITGAYLGMSTAKAVKKIRD